MIVAFSLKGVMFWQMTTAIAIEDVRREVKILRALTGHKNLVQFYEAYEDDDNVYVVMELCKGGELLDKILSRGGKYSEEDAKEVMVQILSVVAYCHLQGVVHRDLKPEKIGFEEFCSAAISVHQLEGMESWEQHARRAYELFEKDGNRPIMIEELASLSFLGFVRLLHGVSSRSFQKA
ncbi:calcium-dependent protein kinase, putative [Fagus crenata]